MHVAFSVLNVHTLDLQIASRMHAFSAYSSYRIVPLCANNYVGNTISLTQQLRTQLSIYYFVQPREYTDRLHFAQPRDVIGFEKPLLN